MRSKRAIYVALLYLYLKEVLKVMKKLKFVIWLVVIALIVSGNYLLAAGVTAGYLAVKLVKNTAKAIIIIIISVIIIVLLKVAVGLA